MATEPHFLGGLLMKKSTVWHGCGETMASRNVILVRARAIAMMVAIVMVVVIGNEKWFIRQESQKIE